MENKMNLQQTASIEKVREVVEASSICLFVSSLTVTPLAANTQMVDSDGTLWFLSNASSSKNREIADDTRVQLFFSNKGNAEYLSIFGKATIVVDRDHARRVWNAGTTGFFESESDPEITLVKVQPVNAHYWDNRQNKMIGLVKMMASAMTGKALDENVQGDFRF